MMKKNLPLNLARRRLVDNEQSIQYELEEGNREKRREESKTDRSWSPFRAIVSTWWHFEGAF